MYLRKKKKESPAALGTPSQVSVGKVEQRRSVDGPVAAPPMLPSDNFYNSAQLAAAAESARMTQQNQAHSQKIPWSNNMRSYNSNFTTSG